MPDDNELRLREMPVDSDGRLGMAFVVGERVVCDFGAMPTAMHSSIAGEPPSPEDARRMELCWNTHDELVEALKQARSFMAEFSGPRSSPIKRKADAILEKVNCPPKPNPGEGEG